jgi:hypothetical protein
MIGKSDVTQVLSPNRYPKETLAKDIVAAFTPVIL